jgi:hypothetical protein
VPAARVYGGLLVQSFIDHVTAWTPVTDESLVLLFSHCRVAIG